MSIVEVETGEAWPKPPVKGSLVYLLVALLVSLATLFFLGLLDDAYRSQTQRGQTNNTETKNQQTGAQPATNAKRDIQGMTVMASAATPALARESESGRGLSKLHLIAFDPNGWLHPPLRMLQMTLNLVVAIALLTLLYWLIGKGPEPLSSLASKLPDILLKNDAKEAGSPSTRSVVSSLPALTAAAGLTAIPVYMTIQTLPGSSVSKESVKNVTVTVDSDKLVAAFAKNEERLANIHQVLMKQINLQEAIDANSKATAGSAAATLSQTTRLVDNGILRLSAGATDLKETAKRFEASTIQLRAAGSEATETARTGAAMTFGLARRIAQANDDLNRNFLFPMAVQVAFNAENLRHVVSLDWPSQASSKLCQTFRQAWQKRDAQNKTVPLSWNQLDEFIERRGQKPAVTHERMCRILESVCLVEDLRSSSELKLTTSACPTPDPA